MLSSEGGMTKSVSKMIGMRSAANAFDQEARMNKGWQIAGKAFAHY